MYAADMNNTESLWQRHKKHLQKINKKWKEIYKEQKKQYSKLKEECPQSQGDIFDYPEMGIGPDGKKTKQSEDPLKKFILPIKPASFKVNDYRVFLGSLHDGFTWHEGDKPQYICPDLRKGTIVDILFWEYIWYEPKYKPLIEEALQVVERDINDRKQKNKPQEKDEKRNLGNAYSKSDQNINIQNFHGIFGNVQAENVQTGDKASIHKHNGIEKNNKGHIGRVFKIIAAIVTFSAALLTCLY